MQQEDLSAERLLTSNLAALSACDADLARRVAQVRVNPVAREDSIVVRPSRSGWPTVLAGGVHIHSAYDPVAEADLLAGQVPADAERVMALGFGAGYILAAMLRRKRLRRLDVAPMHIGVLRAVAQAVDLRPLLLDPRLRFLSTDEDPQLQHPFVVVPPLLRLADAEWAPLRNAAWAAMRKNVHGERMSHA